MDYVDYTRLFHTFWQDASPYARSIDEMWGQRSDAKFAHYLLNLACAANLELGMEREIAWIVDTTWKAIGIKPTDGKVGDHVVEVLIANRDRLAQENADLRKSHERQAKTIERYQKERDARRAEVEQLQSTAPESMLSNTTTLGGRITTLTARAERAEARVAKVLKALRLESDDAVFRSGVTMRDLRAALRDDDQERARKEREVTE